MNNPANILSTKKRLHEYEQDSARIAAKHLLVLPEDALDVSRSSNGGGG